MRKRLLSSVIKRFTAVVSYSDINAAPLVDTGNSSYKLKQLTLTNFPANTEFLGGTLVINTPIEDYLPSYPDNPNPVNVGGSNRIYETGKTSNVLSFGDYNNLNQDYFSQDQNLVDNHAADQILKVSSNMKLDIYSFDNDPTITLSNLSAGQLTLSIDYRTL